MNYKILKIKEERMKDLQKFGFQQQMRFGRYEYANRNIFVDACDRSILIDLFYTNQPQNTFGLFYELCEAGMVEYVNGCMGGEE